MVLEICHQEIRILNVDENAEIKGNPFKSGVFEAVIQITDANKNNKRENY